MPIIGFIIFVLWGFSIQLELTCAILMGLAIYYTCLLIRGTFRL